MLSNYGLTVDKDKKCIAFGLGDRFWRNRKELVNDYNIIAATDSSYKGGSCCIGNINICPPPVALGTEFDYVLVIPDMYKLEIIKKLIDLGIPKEKIIPWFPKNGRYENRDYEISYQDGIIVAQFGSIIIKAHNSGSVLVLKEVFIDGAYECNFGDEELTVIDIGMNVGIATLYFAQSKNVKRVIGFEPFPDTYNQAVENVHLQKENIRNKIQTYNYALSDYNGRDTFNYSSEFPGGMNIINMQSDDGVKIEIKDAGEMLEPILENNKDKILLKIDCEGSEYQIFDSIKKRNLFGYIDYIIMETHMGKEDVIKKRLSKEGFVFYAKKDRDGLGILFAVKH